MPEREEEALADFWSTGNPLGEWLEEECDLTDRDAVTGSTILLNAFKTWMERNEIEEDVAKKWNATKFGRDLGQRQIVGTKDRKGNKVRRGIRLRAADPLLRGNDGGAAERPASPPPKAADDDFGGQAGRWADDDPLGDDA